MRQKAWIIGLATVFAATALPAQEGGPGGQETPTMEQMARQEKALELQAREAQLRQEQELRELNLEARRMEINRQRDRHRGDRGGPVVLLLVLLVVHILLTIWVCKDMREQKIGRALWVPIVLLTGICGAILYALVRLADTRPGRTPPGEA